MTQILRPVDNVQYTERDIAEMMADVMGNGVVWNPAINPLSLTNEGGMIVGVSPGHAIIEGYWYNNNDKKLLALTANTSGSTRYDGIMLRLDRTNNRVSLVAVAGTTSPPALVRGTDIYDMMIGYAEVLAGGVTINRLFDTRPIGNWYASNWCGYIRYPRAPIMALDYTLAVDLYNGSLLGANQPYNVVNSVSFTLQQPTSMVQFIVRGGWYHTGSTFDFQPVRLKVDTTNYYLGSGYCNSGQYHNPLCSPNGPIVENMAAGAHTLSLDVLNLGSGTNYAVYLRAATSPLEFLNVKVIEWLRD